MSLSESDWTRAFSSAPQFKFVTQYRAMTKSLTPGDRLARTDVVRRLFDDSMLMVADVQNLMAALDHIEHYGGASTGVDELSACDMSTPEKWKFSRDLSEELLSGNYTRDEVTPILIPKRTGSGGRRKIYAQTLRDRVVNRALTQILEPLMQLRAQPFSFSRPQMGRWRAIATAAYFAEQEDRTLWITEDLKDAFDNVPRQKLAEILASKCSNTSVCELALEVSRTPSKRGIMQGAAISPLLLNLYLDTALYVPWKNRLPSVPLLRYADDLVVASQCDDVVEEAYCALRELSASAGFKLKHGMMAAIGDLRLSDAAWLGYRMRREGQVLSVRPGLSVGCPEWRQTLLEKFDELHDRSHGWLNLRNSLRGYVAQLAPTHPYVDRRSVCHMLIELAQSAEFDVLDSVDDLLATWDASHQRYLQAAGATYLKLECMREPTMRGRFEKRRMLQQSEVQPTPEDWSRFFKYVERRRSDGPFLPDIVSGGHATRHGGVRRRRR